MIRTVLAAIALWIAGYAAVRAQQPAPLEATVVLVAPASACDEARLDEHAAAREPDGAFTFKPVTPGAHRLTCKNPIDLYLTPNARLRVTLDESGPPRFDGAGASPNRFLHAPKAMTTERFAALWKSTPAEFVGEWDAAHAADLSALRSVTDGDVYFTERETVRLRFKYAWARLVYPYFHWRESDAAEVIPDPAVSTIVAGLPLFDTRWWALREHQELTGALVHERARALLKSQPALRTGDVRWLRAEFEAAAQLHTSRELLLRESTRLIREHVDENGSRGIDPVLARWQKLGPEPAVQQELDKAIAEDRGMRNGHPIAIYQSIEGVDLELHVLAPFAEKPAAPGPAMLWFHGGSGTTGTWWQSPGVVSALRQNGVIVVGVEYRTGSRFDAGPLEQIADASAAYTWVSQNAGRYGIDARRIGVAGFSSGSTLALLLATRGVEQPMAVPKPPNARVYPSALIVTGACPNPTSPSEDGYFRKMVARHGAPADYSPISLIAGGQPPMLIVQARADEYCAYEDARAFVERSVAAGNAAELTTVDGAGHFFGFYYPPGQRLMRESIARALQKWNWATP